jgi:hypothetical protein
MKITLEVPTYDPSRGFQCHWTDGFSIQTTVEQGVVRIQANKAGLVSLANHLLNLAQETVLPGVHLHLDETNALEEPSYELLIEKIA